MWCFRPAEAPGAIGGKVEEGKQERRAPGAAASAEHDAYPARLAPDDASRQVQPVARHHQHEPAGNPAFVGYFERGSRLGQVADQTIDGGAAGLDRSGLQDNVAGCSATFGHRVQDTPEL